VERAGIGFESRITLLFFGKSFVIFQWDGGLESRKMGLKIGSGILWRRWGLAVEFWALCVASVPIIAFGGFA
jgi:hypothetical protein